MERALVETLSVCHNGARGRESYKERVGALQRLTLTGARAHKVVCSSDQGDQDVRQEAWLPQRARAVEVQQEAQAAEVTQKAWQL